MDSQESMILEALKAGRMLTNESARELCRSNRLSARIKDLRNKGYKIETIMRDGVNIFGHKYKYAEYRFVGEKE